LHWPPNPLWDYALELYGSEGVEAACLELQERHGLDVNLLLLCCWLAERGIAADEAALRQIVEMTDVWQEEVVRPLRAVRSRLKARLSAPQPESITAHWPELAAALRQRALALEIDGERLEQLRLAELVAGLAPSATPGVALAVANLQRYRRFTAADRPPLMTLLQAAFPDGPPSELAASLDRLEQGAGRGQPLPHE
jgi:uncharacterized protein (TIGR02444 family)